MKLITPSLVILTIVFAGGVFFKLSAPTKCAGVRANDTLFVLTGDARRIPYALDLLKYHPYRKLEIIGVGGGQYKQMIPRELAGRVSVESESDSTFANALAIKKIADEKNINRIVIVTTEDHINRSLLLMRRQIPNKQIIACPVRLRKMNPNERLWRWGLEYIKYTATLLGLEKRN
ncbi:MAG: YdcF family protein [Rickettsiales bacterium]|jgi:uncharacterized SAM-binding protein YcdF (DUF218 family)|nr:YdcF family protein [Rickettsiales bacterium]